MGAQSQLNQWRREEDKKKFMESQSNVQEFRIELNYLQAHYGLQFAGRLKIIDTKWFPLSVGAMAPVMELIRIPRKKLATIRKNVYATTAADYASMGMKVEIPPRPTLWDRVKINATGSKRRVVLKRYMDIALRRKLILKSFFGDSGGIMVAGVEPVPMTDEEHGAMMKEYVK